MIKNKKKGFTIVELVIVIAVIGILAAVMIPVFTGLIAKANLANDNSLVKNINTQLAAAEIKDGKNVTMYDALQDAKEAGYLVANINARSENQLVWDSKIDRFALIDGEGKVIAGETAKNYKPIDLWQIKDTVDGSEVYSVYASDDFNKTDFEISVGFDAGEKQGIKNIDYVNKGENVVAQNVVIRTNSLETTLSIDAKLDTVYHYGKNGVTVIKSVNTASFHEFGYVPFVEISGGNLVIEASAEVKALHFDATGEGNSAKFQNEDGLKISVDMSKVQAESVPAFSRDNVAVGQDVLVAKVDSDFIWLTGDGTITEVKVSKTESGTKAAVTGEMVGVAEQIANVAVEKNGETVYEAPKTKEEAAVVVEEAKDEEVIKEAEEIDVHYVARIGTKGYDDLRKAVEAANAGETITMLENVTLARISSDDNVAIDIQKSLTIDGNGKTLTTSAGRAIWVTASDVNLTLKNLTIKGTQEKSQNPLERAVQVNEGYRNVNLVIDNCDFVAKMYTVNICSLIDNVNVTIKNGTKLMGWAAINTWSNGYSFTIKDSQLIGMNYTGDKTYAFAAICLEGDTTNRTDLHSSNNVVLIENCVLEARDAEDDRTNKQYIIGFNTHSVNNQVTIKNCEIILGQRTGKLSYDYGTDNNFVVISSTLNDEAFEYAPTVFYYWYVNGQKSGGKYDFVDPFENAWLMDGEYLQLLGNVELANDIEPEDEGLKTQGGTFHLTFGEYVISGAGHIVLRENVICITDKNVSGLFVNANGDVIVATNNGDGTFTYAG